MILTQWRVLSYPVKAVSKRRCLHGRRGNKFADGESKEEQAKVFLGRRTVCNCTSTPGKHNGTAIRYPGISLHRRQIKLFTNHPFSSVESAIWSRSSKERHRILLSLPPFYLEGRVRQAAWALPWYHHGLVIQYSEKLGSKGFFLFIVQLIIT